jgi:hypothetical protein
MNAVDSLGEEPSRRRLAGAAGSTKEVGVGNPIQTNGVSENANDVLLANQIVSVERLGPILPIQ